MHRHIHKLSLVGVALAVVVVSSSTVMAVPEQANVHAQAANDTTTTVPDPAAQPPDRNASDKGQEKRAAANKNVCEKRQKAITNIMTRISDRGQKQLTLFDTIASRVETFYKDKGNTVDNYDALVADVEAKHAAAQKVVDTVSADSATFTCDSTNPKASVVTFKDSLKQEIAALKDYRTAVKNLIVGVKSAQAATAPANGQTTEGSGQ